MTRSNAVKLTCLFMFLTLAAIAAAEAPFGSETTVQATFTGATRVAEGDLDGDGDLDLAGVGSGVLR